MRFLYPYGTVYDVYSILPSGKKDTEDVPKFDEYHVGSFFDLSPFAEKIYTISNGHIRMRDVIFCYKFFIASSLDSIKFVRCL